MKKIILIISIILIESTSIVEAQTGNTHYGAGALNSNTTGSYNSAFGYQALYSNTIGSNNLANSSRALYSNISGNNNVAVGYFSLYANTTGNNNIANGNYSLYSNTSGNQNIASGISALYLNTTGNNNIAIGFDALYSNTTGYYNLACGSFSLYFNTNGISNTAIGTSSLYSNISGNYNLAIGSGSLRSNTTGNSNTATGVYSLYSNTYGYYNTATGYSSLYRNVDGYNNTSIGYNAMFSNIDGNSNTAIGFYTMIKNTNGNYNTATGNSSLNANTTGNNNTAIGCEALFSNVTGNNNTAFGAYSGHYSNYDNTTSIGYDAQVTASNQVRIGNADITSIGGQVSWTTLSDKRFKKEIKQDVPGLDFINKLKPVSFIADQDAFNDFLKIPDSLRIKNNNIPITQSGFIGQDVEKILQEMNITNFSGIDLPKNDNDIYGIRYAEFVVPLVKAVQELSAINKENDMKEIEKDIKINKLEEKISELEKVMADAGLMKDINTSTQYQSELNQNNPNPFHYSTEINCIIPSNSESVQLMIFDLNGKLIKNIDVDERGNCLIKVKASELYGPGMYIYSLLIDNHEVSNKRMILSE